MRILKKLRKKLHSNKGFTLVEMLAALLVVVMMSLMMSVGASVGARVQREATFVAESDILASTINTAVQDVLRYAEIEPYTEKDVTALEGLPKQIATLENALITQNELTMDGGTCFITNNDYGIVSGVLLMEPYNVGTTAEPKYVDRLAMKFQEYTKEGDTRKLVEYDNLKPHFLVSHGVYTTLIIKDFDVAFDDGVFTLTYTISEPSGTKPMTKDVEVSFRPANAEATTSTVSVPETSTP